LFKCRSSAASSYLPEEDTRDRRPDDVGGVLQARATVPHLLVEPADAEIQNYGQDEDHGRVAQGEEEPHAERALVVVDQLARGVVDGGDVIGVERVAHPEGVGQYARADTEGFGPIDMEVAAQGCTQHAPPEDMQSDDGECHPTETRPLLGGETVTDAGEPGRAHLHRNTEVGHLTPLGSLFVTR
jgi:hypothetical protein